MSRPLNAHDDIFNGAHTPSPNAVIAGMNNAECRAALKQFNNDLASFCQRLDIAPALLNLRTPELLMIVCMRQQAIIDALTARLDALSTLDTTA